MVSEATILVYGETSPVDLHLARLTDFFGVEHRLINVVEGNTFGNLLSGQEKSTCVMISARSLSAIFRHDTSPRDVVAGLFEHVPFVLVYGVTPDEQETSTVRQLTNGSVSSVIGFERSDYVYQVSATEKEVTQEFSGLAFGPIRQGIDCGLVVDQHHHELSNLVSINNLPLFASFKKPHSRLFLLACREIIDPESQTDGSLPGDEYFSRLVPVVMFLKCALQDRMWHNPRRDANFIIDDPLLRKSYGFLNYAELLQEMDRGEFTTTVAFIPWNYRRTSTSIAKLIRARSDRFSICIHGCDHTAGEFACTDVEQLHTQLRLATQRMEAHEQRTGVPYAKVMVFPQGKFSTASFGPLKSHNYLAAVNSSPVPEDLGNAHGLTVADLLAPAVSKYKSFPLFVRRYPRSAVDFALDLFLGKPALIVEHHNYFRDGYDTIQEFVTKINALSDKLRWRNLTELISNTSLQREISQDTVECKIFSNHYVIHNQESKWKQYIVLKHEENETPIGSVSVGGKQHQFFVEDEFLRIPVVLPPNSTVEVVVDYRNIHQSPNVRRSIKYDAKVYLRRHLSETRDNYLCKHSGLLSFIYRVKSQGFFAL